MNTVSFAAPYSVVEIHELQTTQHGFFNRDQGRHVFPGGFRVSQSKRTNSPVEWGEPSIELSVERSTTSSTVFPASKKLHLSNQNRDFNSSGILQRWSKHFPVVKHCRPPFDPPSKPHEAIITTRLSNASWSRCMLDVQLVYEIVPNERHRNMFVAPAADHFEISMESSLKQLEIKIRSLSDGFDLLQPLCAFERSDRTWRKLVKEVDWDQRKLLAKENNLRVQILVHLQERNPTNPILGR